MLQLAKAWMVRRPSCTTWILNACRAAGAGVWFMDNLVRALCDDAFLDLALRRSCRWQETNEQQHRAVCYLVFCRSSLLPSTNKAPKRSRSCMQSTPWQIEKLSYCKRTSYIYLLWQPFVKVNQSIIIDFWSAPLVRKLDEDELNLPVNWIGWLKFWRRTWK